MVNGAIYIAKWDVIKSDKSFYKRGYIPFIMSREKSLDIDDLLDFRFAEFLMRRQSDEKS